jgi:DNA-binding Xre family transcriptional regulator
MKKTLIHSIWKLHNYADRISFSEKNYNVLKQKNNQKKVYAVEIVSIKVPSKLVSRLNKLLSYHYSNN